MEFDLKNFCKIFIFGKDDYRNRLCVVSNPARLTESPTHSALASCLPTVLVSIHILIYYFSLLITNSQINTPIVVTPDLEHLVHRDLEQCFEHFRLK